MTDHKPLVLLSPAPQQRDRIFTASDLERLNARFEVVDFEEDASEARFAELLPRAFAVIGQPDLPTAALEAAQNLRAIVNVEGNFFPNVDYATAFRNGVRILGCGTAYSQAVAEYSLAIALDLARGVSREDRAMRGGREQYVSASNADAILLRGADVGIIGYGNLGRAFLPLITPFHNKVRIFDPWLPAAVIEEAGATAATLEEVLAASTFVFMFATATAKSAHLLDERRLGLLRSGARLILVSRAAVADYDALLRKLQAGDIYAAIDVWPSEPLDPASAFRRVENAVLSPHRAGGIPQAFQSIGAMVVDDLDLIAQGLPPARLQPAAPELVGRYENKPVG